jgi:electron transfer flavoprotein beta subunit
MTNIVVLIKQVPDTWSERKLSDGDYTLDREAADAVLDEINERAVEEALQIREREGGEGSVTVLTAGPERASEAIRKALSMGADKAVHRRRRRCRTGHHRRVPGPAPADSPAQAVGRGRQGDR